MNRSQACCVSLTEKSTGHAVLVAIFLLGVAIAAPSWAFVGKDDQPRLCSGLISSVYVRADARGDHAAACVGARRAIQFLSAFGFYPSAPLSIDVIDQIDTIHGTPIVGSYDPVSGRIRVPSWSALTASDANNTIVGLPINRELYVSIYAHEVAHAIIDTAFTGQRLTHAVHDYVAYTVQLATMKPQDRARILGVHPRCEVSCDEGINDTVLALAPHRFAAFAYHHFMASDDPLATLRRVLNSGTVPSGAEG